MANNSYQSQKLFEKGVYFRASEDMGMSKNIDWQGSALFDPVSNPGATRYLRRPNSVRAVTENVDTDRSIQSSWLANAQIKPHQEVEVPLTLTKYVYAPLEYSIEDMTFRLSAEDVDKRCIQPAIATMADQLNSIIHDSVETYVGNTVYSGAPSAGAPASNWDELVLTTNSLFRARGVPYVGSDEKSFLINSLMSPKLIAGNVNKYHAQNASAAYAKGAVTDYAGYNVYDSGILATRVITPPTGAITVSTAFSASGPWTQTSTIRLAFSGTLQAGARLQFAVSGTTVNMCHTSTQNDTGYVKTVVVRESVTDTGAGVPVVVADCIITAGDAKNTLANVLPVGTTVTVINGGSTRPNYAFHNRAIVGASPKLKIPTGVKNTQINVGGFNIAIIEDHQYMSLQSVAMMVAIVGFTVVRPEAVAVTYLGA